MRFLDAKIQAMLSELLTHVARVSTGAAIQLHFREPRHESRDADLRPVEARTLDLRQFLFRLSEYLLGGRNAVQSLAVWNLLGPAHVRDEGTFSRLRDFQCGHVDKLIIARRGPYNKALTVGLYCGNYNPFVPKVAGD